MAHGRHHKGKLGNNLLWIKKNTHIKLLGWYKEHTQEKCIALNDCIITEKNIKTNDQNFYLKKLEKERAPAINLSRGGKNRATTKAMKQKERHSQSRRKNP